MKKLSLRPYHGEIWVCATPDEMRKSYKRLTKVDCPHRIGDGGQYIKVATDDHKDTVWLVYASQPEYMAHEFSHVLLKTFGLIGHDPREGDGEPFCYVLSQLLLESA